MNQTTLGTTQEIADILMSRQQVEQSEANDDLRQNGREGSVQQDQSDQEDERGLQSQFEEEDGEEQGGQEDIRSDSEQESEERGEQQDEVLEQEIGVDVIASALGLDDNRVDVDDSGSLRFKTKIDGQEGYVGINDLIKSYQLEGHVHNKSAELSDKLRKQEEEAAKAQDVIRQNIEASIGLLNVAQQELFSDYNDINWQQLEDEDPSLFAAEKIKFQERYNKIQGSLQKAQQDQQNLYYQQLNERHQDSLKRLKASIPEWNDQEVAKKEIEEISSYLKKNGYDDTQLSLADHKDLLISRKAMLYDRIVSDTERKANIAKKRIKKVPKVIKPGAPSTKQQRKKTQNSEALKKYKSSSRSTRDLAQLLLNR